MLFWLQVKEYELSEVFHHTEDSQHFDVFRSVPHPNSIPVLGMDSVQQEIEEQRQEEERRLHEQAKATTMYVYHPSDGY